MSKGPRPSLDELSAKLRAARELRDAAEAKQKGRSETGSGLALAVRVGLEMVSAVGVGVAIGLLLDYWLETKPWLFIAFFVLGSAAGFLNVFRTMGGFGYAAGYDRKKDAKRDTGSE